MAATTTRWLYDDRWSSVSEWSCLPLDRGSARRRDAATLTDTHAASGEETFGNEQESCSSLRSRMRILAVLEDLNAVQELYRLTAPLGAILLDKETTAQYAASSTEASSRFATARPTAYLVTVLLERCAETSRTRSEYASMIRERAASYRRHAIQVPREQLAALYSLEPSEDPS